MSQYCDHLDVSFCEQDNFEAIFDDAQDYVGFAQAVTSTRILGYFSTVEALTEAVPNPNIGDTYGIGEEAPYSLYVYSANGWIDNGVPSGPPGRPGPQGNDGAQGPPGPAAAVTAWEVKYQASASGTTIPTGTWSENIPEVPDGQFLWTRTEVTYSDGTTTTSYSVVRGVRGADGKDGKDGSDAEVTAENIAAALGYTPAMVNPNLLDNWYFGNPVNQRGKSEYSGSIYGIDRWQAVSAHNMAITADGLKITISSSATVNICLKQAIERFKDLAGKTVTISAVVVENTCNDSLKFRLNSAAAGNLSAGSTGLMTATYTIPTNITELYIGFQTANRVNNDGNYFVVKAMKLELGTQQTLAHQENGVWVLNEIPDYGDQLRRCQRYYRRYTSDANYAGFAMGVYRNSTTARILIYADMRTRPAVAFSSTLKLYTPGGATITPTKITVDGFATGTIVLDVVFSETSTSIPGNVVFLGAISNVAWFDLSADL